MADYFNEYSTFAGNRLPSPADTPYETPGYLRSKRSSRVSSSREESTTPPPSIDNHDKPRDGQYSAIDPRRFTPTLHASLVSEILNLRREIDSKNNLVDNLETALSQTRDDNDTLAGKLSESAKEIRKVKQQVQQMEKGTLVAVEDLAKERDAAKSAFHEIRSKFEVTQKKTRVQDDDAVRAQSIWESEKESWDNERRQLERRLHVTESRLRAVLDEMASQQHQALQSDDAGDESAFKDSGMGETEGSDAASIRSAAPASPVRHKRNMSSISIRPRHMRSSVSSRGTAATPDLYSRSGNTLADELGIDEEEECDDDEYENCEMDLDYPAGVQRAVESRQSLRNNAPASTKTNGANGLVEHASDRTLWMDATEGLPALHSSNGSVNHEHHRSITPTAIEAPAPVSQVKYVDTGYQPSPPPSPAPSPPQVVIADHNDDKASAAEVEAADRVRFAIDPSSGLPLSAAGHQTRVAASPISPPETPVVDEGTWTAKRGASEVAPVYHTASTQTELVELQTQQGHTPKQDSLSPSMFVPSITIHPPSSRPASPRPYALPPGTKNAASQANINRSYKDAGMQTAGIRVDNRTVKLAAHLLPSHLFPSPPLPETASRPRRAAPADSQKTLTKPTTAISSPSPVPLQLQLPVDPSTEMSRSSKDMRCYPLKAIPLPRPVLSPLASPALPQPETQNSNGPLNRSLQYGVNQTRVDSQPLADDVDPRSAHSDYEGRTTDFELDFAGSIPGLSRPPPGRFGLSEPPKAVPEDKEISPERRPDTSGSGRHAPGPSVPSSRPSSQSRHLRQSSKPGKNDPHREPHSRSPSLGSMASSNQSAPTGAPMPPFPIPLRRSSRTVTKPHSDGSQSPLSYEYSRRRGNRTGQTGHARQVSLRKVQSAAIIRPRTGRVSPQKGHRQRRRAPNLTPVQSMAFEDPPITTDFPIPSLPTPLQDTLKCVQDSDSAPRISEETNLVDAIAGTMVGEWMWKYIRKRKSFGIGDDADIPGADQNGFMNSTGHGTRHKRWVWLSPYERTIMWDSKQPTSGPALLGKKGRKLSIQSVLDVQDQTALPKNAELGAAWKRSILILTPERALKLTATTQERHKLWMAALTFLAESQSQAQTPQNLNSIPRTIKAPPPVPSTSFDDVPIKRHRAPSFGKSTVRDSIRLAKGKKHEPSKYADINYESGREDGADFPSVPRLYITTSKHQRKRSYTNPGVQAPSEKFRSLSSSAVQSSYGGSTNGSSCRPSASSKSGSRRDSIASPDRPNFFEAVGTVRMEAFVDPNVRDGVLYVPAPPPVIGGAPRRRRHERDLSQSTVDRRRAGYVFDGDDDPFHGF